MNSKTNTQNKQAVHQTSVKTSSSNVATATKNHTSRSNAKKASGSKNTHNKKILILPPIVEEFRDGYNKFWAVEGKLEKKNGYTPEFDSIDDTMDYLEEYHPEIQYIICPESLKRGFETHLPTLPGTLYQHLKRHHRPVLTQLGANPYTYSPIIWSHRDKKYSTPTLEREKRMNAVRTMSYSRYNGRGNGKGTGKGNRKNKVTITKKDVESWPELDSASDDDSEKKAKGNIKRKSHQRKKTVELLDKDGNEVDSISSSNAFSSLASDDE